jgi:hypothetical protein
MKIYDSGGTIADDGTFTLPVVGSAGWGFIVAGADEERANFTIKSDGTVNLIMASSNVVANADTDGKLCIGTSVASPCVIKNRLAASKEILCSFWYR